MARDFAAQHRADRWFFIGFVLIGWLAIYMGFAGETLKRFNGKADYPAPPVLIVHIVSALGWMVLLSAQVLLIRFRRYHIHRRLGVALLALVPVIVVSGIGAEIVSQRFYTPKFPPNVAFFAFPLGQMISFPLCAIAAWRWRRDSSTHKRLIVVATCVLLSAAFFRWFGDELFALLGYNFIGVWLQNYAGPDALLLLAMVYDGLTRRRVHPAYLLGGGTFVAIQLISTALAFSSFWPGVARRIAGL